MNYLLIQQTINVGDGSFSSVCLQFLVRCVGLGSLKLRETETLGREKKKEKEKKKSQNLGSSDCASTAKNYDIEQRIGTQAIRSVNLHT